MISVDIGAHRFQVRAAAIFIRNGSVLLHRLEYDAYWALPGGRVEPGEEAARTIVREMREELGEEVVSGPLAFAVENFFELRGRPNHELGFYFEASLSADSPLLDATRSHWRTEGVQRLEFRWFALDALDQLDLRPSFLKQGLAPLRPGFEHVVQRG